MATQKRIIARTRIKKNSFGEYVVEAFDQGGKQFKAADYFTDDRDDARETARAMVNESRGVE